MKCPSSGEPCVDHVECDPTSGGCTVKIARAPGQSCDVDSDACTLDACDASGTCEATGDLEKCAWQQQNNPCWQWLCQKKVGCQQVQFVVGASCDDGNPCTTNDTCATVEKGQLCTGTLVPVDDQNPCTDDKCAAGGVQHVALDGVPCGPAVACQTTALCKAGQCLPGTGLPKGAACDDGNPCTGDDACTGSGCAGLAVTVDDQNPCTTDACGAAGVTHVPLDDTTCGVETACAAAPLCAKGVCQPGTPKACPMPCAVDGECDDQNPCTTDACVGKACTHGALAGCCKAATECDDGDSKTVDQCLGNTCKHTPACVAPGCCTKTEDCTAAGLKASCVEGKCVATEPGACVKDADCDDGDATTADFCGKGACTAIPTCEGPGVGVVFDLGMQQSVTNDRVVLPVGGGFVGFVWTQSTGQPCGVEIWYQQFSGTGCKVGPTKKIATPAPNCTDYIQPGYIPWPGGGFVYSDHSGVMRRFDRHGFSVATLPGTGGPVMVPNPDGSVSVINASRVFRIDDGRYYRFSPVNGNSATLTLALVSPTHDVLWTKEFSLSGGSGAATVGAVLVGKASILGSETLMAAHSGGSFPNDALAMAFVDPDQAVLGPSIVCQSSPATGQWCGSVIGLGGSTGGGVLVKATPSGQSASYVRVATNGGLVTQFIAIPGIGNWSSEHTHAVATGPDTFFLAYPSDGAVKGFLLGDFCKKDVDCDDGIACTQDTCTTHGCARYLIPGCK